MNAVTFFQNVLKHFLQMTQDRKEKQKIRIRKTHILGNRTQGIIGNKK